MKEETIKVNGETIEPDKGSYYSKVTYGTDPKVVNNIASNVKTLDDKIEHIEFCIKANEDMYDEKLENLEKSQIQFVSTAIKKAVNDTADDIGHLDNRLSENMQFLKINIDYNEKSIERLKEDYNFAIELITDLDNRYTKLKNIVNIIATLTGATAASFLIYCIIGG